MPDSEGVDKERLRKSLARLWDIYKDMAGVASEVSTRRCPYKDQHDRCTASFGCRNQLLIAGVSPGASNELPICTGSDKLDYRSAWEIQP